MSKSLGTGVDPLELIRLYGADATRFGLSSLVTESQDIRFKMEWESGGKASTGAGDRLAKAEQIQQARNFCTKLWNITRFVLMNLAEAPPELVPIGDFANFNGCRLNTDPADQEPGTRNQELQLADRWILSRFAAASAAVNDAVDRYSLGDASWTLYHFVWDEFADWYVELAKPRFREGDPVVKQVILSVLEGTLRLAHPFLPFITEEIWQSLPGIPEGAALINAPYPDALSELRDEDAEAKMNAVIEVTRAIRNLKAEVGVPQKQVDIYAVGAEGLERAYIEQSARCKLIEGKPEGQAAGSLAGSVELSIAMAGLVDVAAETARITKELADIDKKASALEGRLNNEAFVAKAPAAVVEKGRAELADFRDREAKLRDRLAMFASS